MARGIVLRDDFDASGLRNLAKLAMDRRQIRRLLALAAVYDGMSRADAARIGCMDRHTLRDWVHRFNAEGPDGLISRKGGNRTRRLSPTQMRELADIVETGPDLETDGLVRWRRIDLKRVIEDRFGVVYNERTISKLLVALGFSHISGRPLHPGQDGRVIEAFKKTSPTHSQRM
jgi:transposase